MCVIIRNFKKEKLFNLLDESKVELCFRDNSDGFGITFFNDNLISTVKGFGLNDFKYLLSDIEKNLQFNYFIHFRKATVGKICIENNHPFDVLGDQSLFLMHNGTLSNFNIDSSSHLSDTCFLSNSIKKLLISNQFKINQASFKNYLEKILGNNRAVLISKHHQILLNSHLWFYHENGLLFSKDVSSFINSKLLPFSYNS